MKIHNATPNSVSYVVTRATVPTPGSVIGPFGTLDLAHAECTRLKYSYGTCCHVSTNAAGEYYVHIDEDLLAADNS